MPPSGARPGIPSALVLVARGSPLSRAQAAEAIAALGGALGGTLIESRWVTTHGDRSTATDFRGQSSIGVFEKEVDEEVLARRADVGVHSLKDLPPMLAPGLAVAAVLPRGPSGDLLVGTSPPPRLEDLRPGTRIGTSSPRRQAMVRYHAPGTILVPMRGNVETRIEKMRSGECDYVMLAEAGVRRLGLEVPSRALPVLDYPPAPGQGIIALVSRADEIGTFAVLRGRARGAWEAMQAERSFLAAIGGGCSKALGGQLSPSGDRFVGMAWKEDGSARKSVSVPSAGLPPEELGRRAAAELEKAPWRKRP